MLLRLAADIYASRAHFVLELLQNADDNEYAMGAPNCKSELLGWSDRSDTYSSAVRSSHLDQDNFEVCVKTCRDYLYCT